MKCIERNPGFERFVYINPCCFGLLSFDLLALFDLSFKLALIRGQAKVLQEYGIVVYGFFLRLLNNIKLNEITDWIPVQQTRVDKKFISTNNISEICCTGWQSQNV